MMDRLKKCLSWADLLSGASRGLYLANDRKRDAYKSKNALPHSKQVKLPTSQENRNRGNASSILCSSTT